MTSAPTCAISVAPAFADPPIANQSVFRAVMDALARPGETREIVPPVAAPAPLGPAAASVALTLLDHETPVWLDAPLLAAPDVAQWLRFHTGAPVVADGRKAAFAFLADPVNAPSFEHFSLGTAEYPDRSTTLVLQVDRLSGGQPWTLSGPGVSGTRAFSARPLPVDFRARLSANRDLFPRGLDLLFVAGARVAALPRSVRVAGG